MNLIPTDSPVYIRRLVRELNCMFLDGKAVYVGQCRVFSVRPSATPGMVRYVNAAGHFAIAGPSQFRDANGAEICASRETR